MVHQTPVEQGALAAGVVIGGPNFSFANHSSTHKSRKAGHRSLTYALHWTRAQKAYTRMHTGSMSGLLCTDYHATIPRLGLANAYKLVAKDKVWLSLTYFPSPDQWISFPARKTVFTPADSSNVGIDVWAGFCCAAAAVPQDNTAACQNQSNFVALYTWVCVSCSVACI
jgi:hypothetical protein